MRDWFVSELKALSSPTELARYALDLGDQRVTLIERTLNGPRIRGDAELKAPDFETRIAALRGRVARRRGKAAPVDVLLPPELTLDKVETFPAEAKSALRDEAFWRLERMTPYQPEDLCYDVAVIGVEPKTGFLDVHIAVAPREIVDEALSYARAWGFSPQRVSASTPLEGFPQGPLFLEAASATREARVLKRVTAVLTAAAVALTVIGVGRGVMTRLDAAERFERQAAATEATLAAALAERARVLDLAARAERPALRRAERLDGAEWLAALAESTPNELRIERLLAADGRLRIEGVSPNADAVLAALTVADAFSDPRYAGPIRAATFSGGAGAPARQRFAIETDIAAPASTPPGEDPVDANGDPVFAPPPPFPPRAPEPDGGALEDSRAPADATADVPAEEDA